MTTMNEEPWCITVARTEGLRLMRPDKLWRPIVTVEFDKHQSFETVLGSDGVNPNLKETFHLHDLDIATRVEIKIWHRPQSKKKSKKRIVASASHLFGELVKKQANEPKKTIEVRLTCQSSNKKCTSSRGRPQNGAALYLKLRPPSSAQPSIEKPSSVDGYHSDSCTSSDESDSATLPPSPTDASGSKLRRRVRGYAINTDDENYFSEEFEEEKPSIEDLTYVVDEDDCFDDASAIRPPPVGAIQGSEGMFEWIVASLVPQSILPQYTEKIETPPELSRMERVLASFTMYSELKSATAESQFEKVFARLQMEWTYVGGLLVALAAVDTAVFSISPDSIFTVDPYARSAIAASSIASGLGISCDAWFLLRYNWADLHTFMARARDVYGSYLFFSLSARTPAICMFISAVSLMSFLGLVAFDAWPIGVLITCFMIGLIMTMQFLVYGVHWCASKVVEGGRAGRRGVVRVARRMTIGPQ